MTRLPQRRRNPRNPQVDTPAFKRWFGDSKVVNMWGQPLVVYHGSLQGDIEVFAVPEHRGRLYPMFFFSDNDEVAAEYGEHVYSVYLRIERPLVVDAKGADWTAIPRSAIKMRGWAAQDKKAAQEFMEDNRGALSPYFEALDEDTSTDVIGALAQALGFDGAIINNVIDSASGDTYVPTTVYVVFDPTQIKSARENAGTFDPDDPSIYRNPRRNGRSASTAERTDPDLWEAVKREVTAGSKGGLPGQWSARKAQLAVLLYKQRGGGYWGEKSPTNSLAKWTREKWRTKSGRPSLETGERYLPSRAIAALTDAEYRATTRAKRAGMRKGQQFVPQPEDVALKVRAYRRNTGYEPLRWEDGDDEDDLDFEASGEMLDATSALLHGMSLSGQGKPSADEVAATWQSMGVYPKARALYLHSVSVSPGLRGTGEGRRYVSYIENDVRRHGAEVVVLHADHSLGFWQKQGYTLWPSPPSKYPEMSAIMYKVLGRTNPARRVGKNRR